jgi:endoglucanase
MPLRYWLLLLFIVFGLPLFPAAQAQFTGSIALPDSRSSYQTVFSSDFSNRKDLRSWDDRPSRRWANLAKDSTGNSVLRVRSTGSNRLLQEYLPINLVAGRKLLIRLRLKSDSIGARTVGYKGIKVALHVVAPQGDMYPQLQIPLGKVSWQNAGFTAVIPADATSCSLLLGIEGANGEVLFDDLSVSLFPLDTGFASPHVIDTFPTLRGAMISTTATAEDIKALASLGANHVRWQLTWGGFPDSPADIQSLDDYMAWLQTTLSHIKSLIPLCDSLGIHVLLDLHTLPGGRRRNNAGQEHRLFADTSAQAAFRTIWKEIALQFRNEPALWGYDLANEPLEGYLPDGLLDWQSLAAATAADIRQLDAKHVIVVQGSPTGSPEALQGLNPINSPNTVYSIHVYEPAIFTHQGLFGLPSGLKYPGIMDGKYWDKEALRTFLQPVRDWQLKHGANIYVGEFSAVRWAPDSSAYKYLHDCIDIFEGWGWSWAYHAFRESHVWSVEHDSNPGNEEKSSTITDRQRLLMEAFKKNKPKQ